MGRSDVVSYPRGSVQAVRSHGYHDRQPGLHLKLAPPAVPHLSAYDSGYNPYGVVAALAAPYRARSYESDRARE